jgi:hypothetical protein
VSIFKNLQFGQYLILECWTSEHQRQNHC